MRYTKETVHFAPCNENLLKITSEKYRYLVEGAEERVNKELRIIWEGEKCMKELVPMKERIFKRKSAAEN